MNGLVKMLDTAGQVIGGLEDAVKERDAEIARLRSLIDNAPQAETD